MSQPSAPKRARMASSAQQPMDFTGTRPSLSDGIVLVEGQKFYISKTHLFRHSSFFKKLFLEKGVQEGDEEMVEVKDVTAEGFQIFLELINGQNRLSDENIEAATKCSSICQSDIPIKKCQKFLQIKSKLSKREKFSLADKLDLIALKVWLFSSVKTNEDMDGLLPPLDISNFKPNTVELIAKKSLSINGVHRPPRPIVASVAPVAPVAPVEQLIQRNGTRELRECLYMLGKHINEPWARHVRDERNPLNVHDDSLLLELRNIERKIPNGPQYSFSGQRRPERESSRERPSHLQMYGYNYYYPHFPHYGAPGAPPPRPNMQ